MRRHPAGSFGTRRQLLSRSFKFGKWDFGYEQVFTGNEIWQSEDCFTIEIGLETYLHKVKPLTIEKSRRNTPDDLGTPKEQSQYRVLCGTLAWPAAQTAAHGAATVSIAQAAGGKATVRDMLDLNKSLRS